MVEPNLINELLEQATVAIISSIDDDGFPNTKAMLPPRKHEGMKTFYFTTNTSTIRVGQYLKNPRACIYFFDQRFFRGIMFTGTMTVITDQSVKEMIWHEGDERFYSFGLNDPDYCVLKFTAHTGRYYSNFKSESFDV